MGQNMGQKCGLETGQPIEGTIPTILGFRHIQDQFAFSFSGFPFASFSGDF